MQCPPFPVLFLLFGSCAASAGTPGEQLDDGPTTWPVPPPLAEFATSRPTPFTSGELRLAGDESEVRGHFSSNATRARFRVAPLGEGLVDIELEFAGLLVTATIDSPSQVAELDGFSVKSGATAQMTAAKRRLLVSLTKALEKGQDPYVHRDSLLRAVRLWSHTPEVASLQRSVITPSPVNSEGLCEFFGTYQSSLHDDLLDCREGQSLDEHCRSWAQLGTRYAQTHYFVDGSWTTKEPDHVANLYETGECFGNCGPGCPIGPQTLTRDCLNHDQCVRNGHSLASLHCLDEFLAASDDEFFGEVCPGT